MIVDVHSHILPFVDDGASDMEEALRMAEIAVQSGVGVMIATPHANQKGLYENYVTPRMQDIFEELQFRIRRARISLTLLPGMEIMASDDIIERIYRGHLCPLGNSRIYLVEFPFNGRYEDMDRILRLLLENGQKPMIAHPERYYCVQEDIRCLEEWRNAGCFVQINKGSVFDSFGPISGRCARQILQKGLADVVGSDAHGACRRTPDMWRFRNYLEEEYGWETARHLLEVNPKTILMQKY